MNGTLVITADVNACLCTYVNVRVFECVCVCVCVRACVCVDILQISGIVDQH